MKPQPIRIVFLLLMCTALVAVPAGCVSNTPAQRTREPLRPGDLPGDSATGQPISPEQLTSKDRCPARLHDIEGAMLMYWALHKSLPPNMEDLKAVSDVPLELTCPDTGLPYAYNPQGLRKPGGTKRIVVYDQVRNSDGTRWCIMVADGRPGAAQSTEVIQLPEPIFLAYQ